MARQLAPGARTFTHAGTDEYLPPELLSNLGTGQVSDFIQAVATVEARSGDIWAEFRWNLIFGLSFGVKCGTGNGLVGVWYELQ